MCSWAGGLKRKWLGAQPRGFKHVYNPVMYSPQLLRYFEDSRHVGEVEHPTGAAQVENPACGDILRLTARVRDGILTEVRFKSKGCVPAMACGSAIAHLLQGCSLQAAANVTLDQLFATVGGVPQASQHAGHLAMDAAAALLKSMSGYDRSAATH